MKIKFFSFYGMLSIFYFKAQPYLIACGGMVTSNNFMDKQVGTGKNKNLVHFQDFKLVKRFGFIFKSK